MDGDGGGDELLGLIGTQLHAVEALGIFLRDEFGAVLAGTEAGEGRIDDMGYR